MCAADRAGTDAKQTGAKAQAAWGPATISETTRCTSAFGNSCCAIKGGMEVALPIPNPNSNTPVIRSGALVPADRMSSTALHSWLHAGSILLANASLPGLSAGHASIGASADTISRASWAPRSSATISRRDMCAVATTRARSKLHRSVSAPCATCSGSRDQTRREPAA